MQRFLILLFVLISQQAISQRSKEIHIRTGIGIGRYNTTFTYTNTSTGNKIVIAEEKLAYTLHIPVELRYELTEHINVGLDMKFGKYASSSVNYITRSTAYNVFGVAAEYEIYNDDVSRFFINLGVNTARLNMNGYYPVDQWPNAPFTRKSEWSGAGFKLGMGVFHFINEGRFAFNCNFGYDTHYLKLKGLSYNNKDSNLTNLSGTLKMSGFELNIGLMYRIMQGEKK